MNTTTLFFKKSSKTVMIAAACLQLSQCDSGRDLTYNPDSTFSIAQRYDAAVLDTNAGAVADMPKFLFAGDKIKIVTTTLDNGRTTEGDPFDDNADTSVKSSGQIVFDNFRFNYSDTLGNDPDLAFLSRSGVHTVGGGNDKLVDGLLKLRDTSFGNGSLAQALEVDLDEISNGLVPFTDSEALVIRNSVRSLGYIIDDEYEVLADVYYEFEPNSTNQLLVDEKKITGTIKIYKVWRSLIFEYKVVIDSIFDDIDDAVLSSKEFKIILSPVTSLETSEGTFEIELNSL